MGIFLGVFLGLIVAVIACGVLVNTLSSRRATRNPDGALANKRAKEQELAEAKARLSALAPPPVLTCTGASLHEGYVVTGDGTYYIGPSTKATVDTAGNIAVTRRATLTRFALLGFGPALLFQKKQVHDARELYLLIEDDDWMTIVACDPSEGEKVRRVAARINEMAKNAPDKEAVEQTLLVRGREIRRKEEEVQRLSAQVDMATTTKSQVGLSLAILLGLPGLVVMGLLLYLWFTG